MSRVGFSAKCQDCPTMIGDAYGETIHNGVESWSGNEEARMAVLTWATEHAAETEHTVNVNSYISMDVEFTGINPNLWKELLGG